MQLAGCSISWTNRVASLCWHPPISVSKYLIRQFWKFWHLLCLMKNWWWAQPPFLHIHVSLLFTANAQADVSYTRTREKLFAPHPELLLPAFSWEVQCRATLPVLLLAAFLVFCISFVSLWYFSHTHRCVTLIPLPLRHVFMIQDSKGQRYPCSLWEHWEQQKDVSMDTMLKTWVSASCSILCTSDILRIQLSLPAYTTDLVIGDLALLWLKSFAVSAIPYIKKLNGFLELSWVQ